MVDAEVGVLNVLVHLEDSYADFFGIYRAGGLVAFLLDLYISANCIVFALHTPHACTVAATP